MRNCSGLVAYMIDGFLIDYKKKEIWCVYLAINFLNICFGKSENGDSNMKDKSVYRAIIWNFPI